MSNPRKRCLSVVDTGIGKLEPFVRRSGAACRNITTCTIILGALACSSARAQAGPCPCDGDVNGSGGPVDDADLVCVIAGIENPAACPNGDINCDGVIDACDLGHVYNAFFGVLGCFPCGACCTAFSDACPFRVSDPGLCLCRETTEFACEQEFPLFFPTGEYHGDGTTCDPNPCDCNNNGIPDGDDIAQGTSPDCNENGVPDGCEVPDPSLVGSCCISENGQCTNVDETLCDALGGIWGGPCTECPEQNIFVVVEPGGEIFVHVIGPPIECGGKAPQPTGPCPPGPFIDPWVSPANASMCHIFGVGAGSPAIPADFFAPGSDPFTGSVCLEGVSLGSEFGDADTLILRSADPFDRCDLPSANAVQVDIEIVALSLVGTNPITVTFNGGQNPEQWDVEVDLSEIPAPHGILTAVKEHCNGGTYTSNLNVQPRFTFTKVSDPKKVRVLDTGFAGIPPVQLDQNKPAPWASDVDLLWGLQGDPCSDFHAGVADTNPSTNCDCNDNGVRDTCDLEQGTSSDCQQNGIADECDIEAGTSEDCQPNGIPDDCDIAAGTSLDENGDDEPDECEPEVPTVTQWGMLTMLLLLFSVATIIIARRRTVIA